MLLGTRVSQHTEQPPWLLEVVKHPELCSAGWALLLLTLGLCPVGAVLACLLPPTQTGALWSPLMPLLSLWH